MFGMVEKVTIWIRKREVLLVIGGENSTHTNNLKELLRMDRTWQHLHISLLSYCGEMPEQGIDNETNPVYYIII